MARRQPGLAVLLAAAGRQRQRTDPALEIRNVYYNGHLVLKRGHVPILNVKYETGGCGGPSLCYRDWQDEQSEFQADNIITQNSYAEPTLRL